MIGSKTLFSKLTTYAKQQGSRISIVETATNEQITYEDLSFAVAAMIDYLEDTPKTIVVMLDGGIVDAILWISCLMGGHLLIPNAVHGKATVR
jgi:hypothetical protein